MRRTRQHWCIGMLPLEDAHGPASRCVRSCIDAAAAACSTGAAFCCAVSSIATMIRLTWRCRRPAPAWAPRCRPRCRSRGAPADDVVHRHASLFHERLLSRTVSTESPMSNLISSAAAAEHRARPHTSAASGTGKAAIPSNPTGRTRAATPPDHHCRESLVKKE